MAIGENIKFYRKKNKFSQKELGAKLGVSNKTICSWEIGRTEPNMENIEMMCHLFNCNKTQLISGYGESIPEFESDQLELIEMYSKLTAEQKHQVLALLRSFVNFF